jgi:hypothetical protein
MPARPVVLAIVVFWVATSGWIFHKELWPRLRPGEPPPYSIDLADEARQHYIVPIRWRIFREGTYIGVLKTKVKFHEADDTFELTSDVERLDLGKASVVHLQSMESMYRVDRDGNLREIVARVEFGLRGPVPARVKAQLEGKVKDLRFLPHVRIESPLGNKELDLDPVQVSTSGSVLNPLHPVNRINGLRPGQHWRTPLVDPLRDLAANILGTDHGVRMLSAEVLPDIQLHWYNGRDRECLVVEFTGDDISAHIWVREKDGMVLRLDARVRGDEMVLERE